MNKLDVAKVIGGIKPFTSRHLTEILTGVGIAGMITSSVLAVKATPKALRCIEEKKKEVYEDLDPINMPSQAIPDDVKLKPVEILQSCWKCYIPSFITMILSTACLIGANRAGESRYSALVTAYNLGQSAISEYKEKTLAIVGEEEAQKIHDAVSEEIIKKEGVKEVNHREICAPTKESVKFFDPFSGRYFYWTIPEAKLAVAKLNNSMMSGAPYVSLNDLYSETDHLDETRLGNIVGWRIDDGEIELDPNLKAIVDPNGNPCVVLDFLVGPRVGYDRYF